MGREKVSLGKKRMTVMRRKKQRPDLHFAQLENGAPIRTRGYIKM